MSTKYPKQIVFLLAWTLVERLVAISSRGSCAWKPPTLFYYVQMRASVCSDLSYWNLLNLYFFVGQAWPNWMVCLSRGFYVTSLGWSLRVGWSLNHNFVLKPGPSAKVVIVLLLYSSSGDGTEVPGSANALDRLREAGVKVLHFLFLVSLLAHTPSFLLPRWSW